MWNASLDDSQGGIKIAGRITNNLRYADDTWWQKVKNNKEPLDESEKGDEKVGLELNIQKTKIMASSPITSWQVDAEKRKLWQILFFWAQKSLQMVIAAMK